MSLSEKKTLLAFANYENFFRFSKDNGVTIKLAIKM